MNSGFAYKSYCASRIASRKRRFDILFLAAIFVVVLFVSAAMTVNIHNSASEKIALSRANETAKKFHSSIVRTLVLIEKAANSNALQTWFSDEENPEKRETAYHEIMDYSRVLPNPHMYFGIHDSLNEFSFQPDTELEDFGPYKKLTPGDPSDVWYFECAASEQEYLLNFDKDDDSKIWKLWLNHKVWADSNLAGVFCSALETENLLRELFAGYDAEREQGFLIDEEGAILMGSGSAEYYSSETETHIQDVCGDPKFASLLGEILADKTSSPPQSGVMKSAATPFRYNAITRIPETGWSVVVVFNSDYLTGFAGAMNFLPLPLTLLLSLVAYAVVSNLHTGRLVFRPLALLTHSIAESESDNVKMYGYKRADEIGELSRAIRESRNRLKTAYTILREASRDKEEKERLLYAVNKTAAILLTSPDDEDKFRDSIHEAMREIGVCLDIDRVCVWRTEMINDVLHYVPKHEWRSGVYKEQKSVFDCRRLRCFDSPEWTKKFNRKECVNGPVKNLTKFEQDILSYNKLKSVLLVPIHLRNTLWGFVNFGDCRNERTFGGEEINILRSAGLMMVSAINRSMQTAQIREAQEHAKLMLDATPLACHLWDRNLNNFDCNEESVKFYGLKNKREFGDRFFELSPEYQRDGSPSRETALQYIRKAFNEGRLVFQWVHRLLDGTPIPSEVTLVRVPHGDDYVVAGYTRDLRESDQMMREIDRKDKLLHIINHTAAVLLQSETDNFDFNLFDCMGMLAKAVDADRVYIWKNYAKDGRLYSSQIHEWSGGAEPQQGKEFTEEHLFGGIISMDKKLADGQSVNALVREMPSPEREFFGAQGILSILLLPVFLKDEFWGFVGFDDCHNERLFSSNEESILRSGGLLMATALLRNEMTRNIRSSAFQLEEALEKAQEANMAKTNFLANMSHEMRTPLNAIIGLSELTLTSERMDDEVNLNLIKIHNAGVTLLSTVNDILDISKIEAGKLELVPIEYEFPSLVNDVITQNAARMEEKPLTFILNIEKDLPLRLYGDELRVKEILNNLLSNAFKYTREGTVELGIRCVRESEAVWLTAWVKDSGIGIRREEIDKLFTEYVQLDKTSNRKIEGTGLGLAISKRLAELMDGKITVESEYGGGSVFTARLKQKYVSDETIGPDMVQNLKNFRYIERKRRQNLRFGYLNMSYARVLVVDDIITNLDVAKGMLKPYGMTVDCVTSGQEAVDAIREEKVRYNAVFMDHMMPGMDGIEAVRIIRETIGTEYAKTIPIIALTANAIIGNEEKFLSAGFQAYISKPIELPRLDSAVREWVRDKEQEKLLKEQGINPRGARAQNVRERRRRTDRRSGIDRRVFGANVAGLDLAKGMERFGNNRETYLDVMGSFAVNTRPLLERIREPGGITMDDYAIIAHGIKGSSRGIGAFLLGDKAEALEQAAKKGDAAFVSANNGDFIVALEELIQGIEEALRGYRRENPKPKKDRPDSETLERLLAASRNYNMDEADAAIGEIEKWEYRADNGLAAWLKENVDLMNFTELEEKLSALLSQNGPGEENVKPAV